MVSNVLLVITVLQLLRPMVMTIYAKTINGKGFFTTYNEIVLDNCKFLNNTVEAGGALYLSTSNDVIVENSVFENNNATDMGGVMYIGSSN